MGVCVCTVCVCVCVCTVVWCVCTCNCLSSPSNYREIVSYWMSVHVHVDDHRVVDPTMKGGSGKNNNWSELDHAFHAPQLVKKYHANTVRVHVCVCVCVCMLLAAVARQHVWLL